MGTFVERIHTLRENVGAGRLSGNIEVNQRMAADQHYHEEYRHPDGGKAYYLRDPFFDKSSDMMQRLADGLLEDDGNGFAKAMMDNMESMSLAVYNNAPWEFGDLRASGHPSVLHNGVVLHDRAPHCARLSDADIRAKQKLSRLIDPSRYDYEPSRVRRGE